MLDQLPSLIGTGPQYEKLERAYIRRLATRRRERLAQLTRTTLADICSRMAVLDRPNGERTDW